MKPDEPSEPSTRRYRSRLAIPAQRYRRPEPEQCPTALHRHHLKPRPSLFKAVAHQQLRRRAFAHAPNGKCGARPLSYPPSAGVRRRCIREKSQNASLHAEHRRRIKREHEVPQRDRRIESKRELRSTTRPLSARCGNSRGRCTSI
jgi:hypothetical protein